MKPSIEQIKYLGRMYAQDAWGNDDAEKALLWQDARLREEMEKNMELEQRLFTTECQLIRAKKQRSFIYKLLTP